MGLKALVGILDIDEELMMTLVESGFTLCLRSTSVYHIVMTVVSSAV